MGFVEITVEERRETHEALLAFAPAVPLVAELAFDALGPSWLETVNRRLREAEPPKAEIRGLDERAALSVLAFTWEVVERIGPEWSDRARRLNGIFNASLHANESGRWRPGDAARASQLADEIRTFLEAGATGQQRAQTARGRTADERLRLAHHRGSAGSRIVSAVVFDFAGARIATAGDDGRACVWDAVSGDLLHALGHKGEVSGVAFSADGTQVATVSRLAVTDPSTVSIWDASSGEQRARWVFGDAWAKVVSFSPDGSQIATIDNAAVCLWDVARGQRLTCFQYNYEECDAVFGPDCRLLAAVATGAVARVFDISSGVTAMAPRTPPGGVRGWLERTSRGALDAAMGVTNAVPQATVSGGQGELSAVALSPGGGALIATAGEDQTTRVWDAASGREIAAFGHDYDDDKVRLLAFSPDASLIVTGHGFDLDEDILESPGRRVWDIISGCEVLDLPFDGGITDVALSPDSTLIAGRDTDGDAYLWDITSGCEVVGIAHPGGITDVAISPSRMQIATAGTDGAVRVWDITAQSSHGR